MAKLVIDSLQKIKGVRKIARAVYKTLGQTAKLKAEIAFYEAQDMQKLNLETRGIDSVTDVLSYPTLDGIRGKVLNADEHITEMDGKYLFIGSIVLCNEKIKAQAQEFMHSEERERTYLIVHGLMHLFGYDHIDENDKKQMRQKEKEALALLGIKD